MDTKVFTDPQGNKVVTLTVASAVAGKPVKVALRPPKGKDLKLFEKVSTTCETNTEAMFLMVSALAIKYGDKDSMTVADLDDLDAEDITEVAKCFQSFRAFGKPS